ncbi:MAG: NAD(P)/FAD-dependent oxidoreductase [Oscillospiraceae bacterium]
MPSAARVTAALEDNCIVLRGTLDRWDDVVRAGQMAATKYSTCHVVNDITFTGGKDAPMHVPALRDDALDGQTPDVLIIGGGISGVSIARELARKQLDILVVDKECDLALGASGRNDGEVHPGIDLGRGSVKHKYIRRGNAMFDQICKELDVPFSRVGQYVCFQHGWLRPAVWCYCMWRKYHDGISDTRLISGKELLRREPNFNEKTSFAISNPDSGCVCPYGLTIAYAENAVQNGARIALNTAVLGMDVENGKITAVHTNRGTLHPALVINAAGVFAEEVARMAGDRFFSIHPAAARTASSTARPVHSCTRSRPSRAPTPSPKRTRRAAASCTPCTTTCSSAPMPWRRYEKENTATYPESIAHVFSKQKITMPALTERDIITYFTGVRAPRSRRTSSSSAAAARTTLSTSRASSPRPDDGARRRGGRGGHGRQHPRARPPRGRRIPTSTLTGRASPSCARWTTPRAQPTSRKIPTTASSSAAARRSAAARSSTRCARTCACRRSTA